ncbi:uncharacterized protein M421DRAFT_105043 [Didymella exigua CBS 183.55]|uniref:Xylanolytic transcriptional activator regulatory domain-containing protein n=1 Tax=Didymella exigua CBS 183.55 TaxID=1150837 RepID=A0A6A5R2Y7_9PLEO|nr:uncharacterized protein M421DRAFT_105043 [Didymella exigua CBS 183.55]KAF1922411.1 hypothetical protein M421DRAFT_105043 [Didymella exigua CBS 183.55]
MSSKKSPSISTATIGAVEDLQARLAKVEEMLGIRSSRHSTSNGLAEDAQPHAIGTVVVKGSRSIFYGQNNRTTLLNQFLEVREFINEISNDKQVQASVKQIKFLQNKSRSKIGSPDSAPGSDFSMALLKLREYLPPKAYCDRLVHIHCQHFERTFRVLHIPTFMRRYYQIWMPVSNENADIFTSSSIIPEVTTVMTMAYHMDDSPQVGEDRNHRTYLKDAAMDLIQAWLDELSRKQRTELATLQVDVLLLLSRSLRGIQPEQLWSATGALVRSAMVMGLNVDPAIVSGITMYMPEMRRRLWATIIEVDLQASMFCGMPLAIPELNSRSVVPSNLDDREFDESSTVLSASHPKHVYMDSLYQVVLATSLPQRMKALSVIQHSTPDIKDGIRFGWKVEECLLQKPQTMSLHDNDEAPRDSGALIHRVFLDLYMRRPLIRLYMALIHGPQAQNTANRSLIAELGQHCLESSRVILSTRIFTQFRPPNFFYNTCKMDILWAALTLCQEISQCYELNMPKALTPNLVHAVETTIAYLINRIEQKGSDLKDIVFLALVLQSVQTPITVPDRSQILQQTARKTLATCREKLLHPSLPSELPQPLVIQTTTRTEQYFGDLSELAVEYNTFQAGPFDPDGALRFPQGHKYHW